MKLELKIFATDTHAGRRFRFAIFDSDKPGGYPRNFVCLLPSRVSEVGKSNSIFQNIFGNKGVEQAKRLLTEALKKARNVEIKNEVERRLELLNPNPHTIKPKKLGFSFSVVLKESDPSQTDNLVAGSS